MYRKKVFILLLTIINLFIINISVTYAKEETISTVGEYVMGQNDTLNDAQDGALSDALRSAVEQIGVYVRSKTQIRDFKVTKDSLDILSNHSLKIIKKEFEKVITSTGDIHIKAYITIQYDLNQVVMDLKELIHLPEQAGTQDTSTITLYLENIGERTGKYEGEKNSKGLPHGHGKFTSKNPQGMAWFYEGQFTNGTFHGKGKQVFPSIGLIFEGNFVNGMLEGYGKRIYRDHPELDYEGSFLHGQPMLSSCDMKQTVEYGQWDYNVTKVYTTPSAGSSIANGVYLIVVFTATNNANIQRQFWSLSGMNFVLFDKTSGKIFQPNLQAMGALRISKIQQTSGKQDIPWCLSFINPGLKVNGIPIIFDIPSNLPVNNLYILPENGFGKATPINLHL